MTKATGTFEVALEPVPTTAAEGADEVARMVIAKTYHGDLVARGRGQMLASTTAVEGSAGYVAIEVVVGELAGRTGSFVLQHNGVMNRGDGSLHVQVLPDSATGELDGLTGDLAIIVDENGHRYDFEYHLP